MLTHTNMVSAYRGAGRPEAIYLIERLMDQAAAEMKMDPAELRRRNLIPPTAMPYTTPMGETFDSGNFAHMSAAHPRRKPTGTAIRSGARSRASAAGCAAARCPRSWSGPAWCTRRRIDLARAKRTAR